MGIIYNLRRDYNLNKLNENDTPNNPLQLFQQWFEEIKRTDPKFEVNAMALATATKNGIPSNRMVLLKEFSDEGFVFFTNYKSRKGVEIKENPNVALLFFWHPLERQVRIEGKLRKLPRKESEEYFNSRPFESKIGAWISPQSKPVPGRDYIENAFIKKLKVATTDIPKPTFWGGYLVKPNKIEFWQGRSNRLHDRIEYLQTDKNWLKQRLAP